MENNEYEKNIDIQKLHEPPVFTLNFVMPDSIDEFQYQISNKLNTQDLLKALSNFLFIPKERIILLYYGLDVTTDPLYSLNRIFHYLTS